MARKPAPTRLRLAASLFAFAFVAAAGVLALPSPHAGLGKLARRAAEQLPLAPADQPDLDDTPVRFDGQVVARVFVPTGPLPGPLPERDHILELLERRMGLDVWGVHTLDGGLGWGVDVRCDREQLAALEREVAGTTVAVKVVGDVQEAVDRERERLFGGVEAMKKKTPAPPGNPAPGEPVDPDTWFNEYHPYDDIIEFFNGLAAKYPELVTVIPSVGKTYEGRDIAAVKICAVPERLRDSLGVKQVWWQGLIHAREWISGSTVQYLAHKLTSSFDDEGHPDHAWARNLLNATEFTLIPAVNPDGYAHSWAKNRLWRKNRRPVAFGAVGVDLNRNYPDGWGTGGGSSNPSSEAYEGEAPLTEPEAIALTNYFTTTLKRAVLAIDFHSYSQLVLRPLGYAYTPTPHEPFLKAAGDIVRDAIRAQSGKKYVSEREIDLYKASGTAEDWFYSAKVGKATTEDRGGKGRVYGYTIELRPSAAEGGWGGEGFILPPASIKPVGEEIWAAMKPMLDYVLANPLVDK